MALASMASAYICGYPQWTIPGVGDDWGRCDWEGECPKRVEEKCRKINVYENDTCSVTCSENESKGTETWKCAGDDTWVRVGSVVKCADEPVNPDPLPAPVDPEPADDDEHHNDHHDDHHDEEHDDEEDEEDKGKEDPPGESSALPNLKMASFYAVSAALAFIL